VIRIMSHTARKTVPQLSVHLDAVRGVAALVVFFGHAREIFLASPTAALSGTATSGGIQAPGVHTTWGHQAVIVFFVLSGLLVGGSVIRDIRNDRWSWKKYLVQRITRLWIVLIPAILIGWGLDRCGTALFEGKGTIYDGPAGQTQVLPNVEERLRPSLVVGNALFLQTILVENLGTNVALWSLANEFWYYIAFPLLAIAAWGSKKTPVRLLYGALLAALLAFVGPPIASYFVIWLLGAAIAVAPLRIPRSWQRPVTAASLVVFAGVNFFIRRTPLPLGMSDSVLALAFVALLYSLLHHTQPAPDGWSRRTAQFVSQISYTLYVCHLPLLVFASAVFQRPWHRLPTTIGSLVSVVCILGIVLAVVCLIYSCFEAHTDRIRHWLGARVGLYQQGLSPAGRSFQTTARPSVGDPSSALPGL